MLTNAPTDFQCKLLEALNRPITEYPIPEEIPVYTNVMIQYGINDGMILSILLSELERDTGRTDDGFSQFRRQYLINAYQLGEMALMSAVLRLENDGILITRRINRQAMYYRIDLDKLEDLVISKEISNAKR